MVLRLNNAAPDFDAAFEAFVKRDRAGDNDVAGVVRDIIASVRKDGLQAVQDLTRRFDGFELTPETLRVSADEIDKAEASCNPDDLKALGVAAARIRAYHEKQLPADERYNDAEGVTLGWRWTSVDAAGLYAPGGLAAYPSSVLMNAIPAKVAGVHASRCDDADVRTVR